MPDAGICAEGLSHRGSLEAVTSDHMEDKEKISSMARQTIKDHPGDPKPVMSRYILSKPVTVRPGESIRISGSSVSIINKKLKVIRRNVATITRVVVNSDT